MKILPAAFLAALALPLFAQQDWPPVLDASKDTTIDARLVQTFEGGVRPEWGYASAQKDTFILIHPKEARKNAPLYVVLHSAGHDVFSCVNCTKTVGNHDIYRSPDDHYGLCLDCGKNRGNDWWWGGMHLKDPKLAQKNGGGASTPVEKRVMDTVKWVMEKYGIDPNRVYLSGNSMGGSGTLGLGVRHGDVFAAIKANVPAGIEHVSQRMYFAPSSVPAGVQLPDPPVVVDYSAPNDGWSAGHERFVKAMEERKYALYFYWGPFGHANNSAQIMKVNDLIDSFDWLSVRKNEPYIVFTNASCNSPLPWPEDLKNTASGQVNAFFRWKNIADTAEKFEAVLSLTNAAQLQTKFEIPKEAGVDITVRRAQHFKLAPGTKFQWSFDTAKGEGTSDAEGLVSIPALKLTREAKVLRVSK
jgi:predicted esterase